MEELQYKHFIYFFAGFLANNSGNTYGLFWNILIFSEEKKMFAEYSNIGSSNYGTFCLALVLLEAEISETISHL